MDDRCPPPELAPYRGFYPVRWSEPGYLRKRVELTRNAFGAGVPPRVFGEVVGTWNACDVWLGGAELLTWGPVEMTLWALVDGVQVPIARKLVSEGSLSTPVDGSGNVSALVFSVRGHACKGFRVTALGPPAAAPLAELRMSCWGEDSAALYPLVADRTFNSRADFTQVLIASGHARLKTIQVYNASGADRFLQLFSTPTAAAAPNGTIPDWVALQIPTLTHGAFSFGDRGLAFPLGLLAASSTTRVIKTITAAPDMWFSAIYSTP